MAIVDNVTLEQIRTRASTRGTPLDWLVRVELNRQLVDETRKEFRIQAWEWFYQNVNEPIITLKILLGLKTVKVYVRDIAPVLHILVGEDPRGEN